MARTATKTERLNLRATFEQSALISRAAAIRGQNVTDFVLSSAVESARRAIDESERMALDARDGSAFVDSLLQPPAPSARARAAARRYRKLSRT